MPLNVSDAYSAQFNQFVQFAEAQSNPASSKAIARLDQAGAPLAVRTISAATDDRVYAIRRSSASKIANNDARTMFRKAVADMFGGESRIPPSVLKAMEMKDYECGKPLTARRIMAVKTAVDAYNTFGKVDFFADKANLDRATRLGYTPAELVKINRVANLLMSAIPGITQEQALTEVMTPGYKANRLMGYGGRFTENVETFAQGLKLLDDFATWFNDLGEQIRSRHRTSMTAINQGCPCNSSAGLECFVFEELASNRKLDISGSMEDVFGMKNNPATRFFLRDLGRCNAFAFLQMPPDKRSVFFRCTELLLPLASSPKEALSIRLANDLSIARLFRHFDELEKLQSKGQLNLKTLWETCFTDLEQTVPDDPARAIGKLDLALKDMEQAYAEKKTGLPLNDLRNTSGIGIMNTIASYVCDGYTMNEACDFYERGETPPIPSLKVGCSTALDEIADPTNGLTRLSFDLIRADGYTMTSDPNRTSHPKNPHFTVNVPGANPLKFHFQAEADAECRQKLGTLKDGVEALCGTAHQRQINVIYFSMGQGALSKMRAGFPDHGVTSNEHSAVTFSLSRDDTTGAITIRYDSPPGCPITFNWTTTVDIDGRATSTPIQVIGQPTP